MSDDKPTPTKTTTEPQREIAYTPDLSGVKGLTETELRSLERDRCLAWLRVQINAGVGRGMVVRSVDQRWRVMRYAGGDA